MYRFDISNNLVTLANSILKYFTGESFHTTNANLDCYLSSKKYKKIAVLLFDGFGKSIREKTLKESDFLRKKTKFTISSIFPPTTVAATTAINTAKYPVETGWLGWEQYFKDRNQVVEMFTNRCINTGEYIEGPSLSNTLVPYTNICDLINKNSSAHSELVMPYPIDKQGPNNLNDWLQKISSKLNQYDEAYYYCYWASPDNLIHEYGTDHPKVRNFCKLANKLLVKFTKEHPDTLFIVLADHSLVDSKFFYIYEHDDFASTLTNTMSLDSRSTMFHVKEDKKEEFVSLFNKYYGQYFVLKTRQEVIDEKWFCEGNENPHFRDFLGDFMATSVSEYGFTYDKEYTMKGSHSGSLEEESLIDVSLLNI
jgi:predicted AlkP superfamily pyrophosphatase or phosphodiesterase